MNEERHFHPCDCDECLNAGGGLVLAGMGVVVPVKATPARASVARIRAQRGPSLPLLAPHRAVEKGEPLPRPLAQRKGPSVDRGLGFSLSDVNELEEDFGGGFWGHAAE